MVRDGRDAIRDGHARGEGLGGVSGARAAGSDSGPGSVGVLHHLYSEASLFVVAPRVHAVVDDALALPRDDRSCAQLNIMRSAPPLGALLASAAPTPAPPPPCPKSAIL